MKYYLAPMEGLTTYIFRQNYYKHYNAADKYFTPFIANRNLSTREINDILPEHNTGMITVPQILTNKSEDFLSICATLASYGYDTVNLNLGCPSGTVVAKNRGAGFLGTPIELERFLDEIFDKCTLKISIKTRIGIDDRAQWQNILRIYEKYPMDELIIHPRLQCQGYGGNTDLDAYRIATEQIKVPLCYNGDILCHNSEQLLNQLPPTERIMIGRGVLQNPEIINHLKGQDIESPLETLHAFHSDLLDGYTKIMSGDTNTLYKMKDLWTFLSHSFHDSDKYLKKIRKANRIADYSIAVEHLFRECTYTGV